MTIAYGYLRHLIPCPHSPRGFGSHRFACVAIEHDPKPSNYRVSVYLHNPKRGSFNSKYALAAAIGRLNSERKSTVLTFDQLKGNGVDLIMNLNLGPAIVRYGYAAIHGFDLERNTKVINGMIKEVDAEWRGYALASDRA